MVSTQGSAEQGDGLAGEIAGKNSSTEILRSTSSELFVAIFLDEVPETGSMNNDSRGAVRDRETSGQNERSGMSTFLFTQIEAASPFIATADFNLNQPGSEIWQEEQKFRDKIIEKVVIGSTAAVSTSVSVGYVVWMLKGGSLITTVLSSIPAWQSFDPLPVLQSF